MFQRLMGCAVLIWLLTATAGLGQEELPGVSTGGFAGVSVVNFAGYEGCLQLDNGETRVILGPHCGGRLLSYARHGKEALPLNPAQDGWTWIPGAKTIDPYGGRFDIGPELTLGRHPTLWLGTYEQYAMGPRAARMISLTDPELRLQLHRFFRLAPDGSHLRCTQKIKNLSDTTVRVCHWSRTFALGGGICVVPLNPHSRYPRGYLTYGPGPVMNYRPQPHPNVQVRDGYLEIRGIPPFSKFMVDTEAGWLAYLMPNDLVFVKRFAVYPQRAYAEASAATLSIFYYPGTEEAAKPPDQRGLPIDFCELEPIGPTEFLAPGQSASYSEDWWLLSYPFPREGQEVDLAALAEIVARQAVVREK